MINIHDSKLLAYNVDLEEMIIELLIEDENSNKNKIIFKDVLMFDFKNQLNSSILLDIQEDTLHNFMNHNKEIIQKGKNYLWPIDYNEDEELILYIKNNNFKYYIIQSSYGLSGWVINKNISFIK